MYCDYYGFREKPFSITPNPRFVFLSANHREAFAHLLYGIDSHAGFIVLTGEVGTGKTTVLRSLLAKLDDDRHRTALVLNPCLSAPELLRSINREYGLPWEGLCGDDLLHHLNRFLLSENGAGRTVVLVIDEAQHLAPEVLEQVRLISNLETDTDKLIQIVLAGQPELERLLARPELRQVVQRVTVRYRLLPMGYDDTKAYVEHRIAVAGGRGAAAFTSGALRRIYRHAGGVPRLVNIACDRALLFGYADKLRVITRRTALRAIREIRDNGTHPWRGRLLASALLLLLLMAAVVTGARHLRPKPSPPAPVNFEQVSQAMAAESEAESARNAFNAVLAAWNAPPFDKEAGGVSLLALERFCARHGFRSTRLTGSTGLLLRFEYPAVLECTIPAVAGRRYLGLVGTDKGRYVISPPVAGRRELTDTELARLWTGHALILWRNTLEIPELGPGHTGKPVALLQSLLRSAGVYGNRESGRYDRQTADSVRQFQIRSGLPATGRTDTRTIILLYRAAGLKPIPSLAYRGKAGTP